MSSGAYPIEEIETLLHKLEVTPSQIDLILDLGPIPEEQLGGYKMSAMSYLKELPQPKDWRSLILAGSSFPDFLSDFAKNYISTQFSAEWELWIHVMEHADSLSRRPTFSDYAIAHPEYPVLDFRVIKMVPNIRYTHKGEWLIIRGGYSRKRRRLTVSSPDPAAYASDPVLRWGALLGR